MIIVFIFCKSSETNAITHIICISPPAIFEYPSFKLVSGSDDPKIQEEAREWFKNGCKPNSKSVKRKPSMFSEAMDKARQHRGQLNLEELSEAVGISEMFLTLCIDDLKWKGAVARIPVAYRQKFIYAIEKLNLSSIPSESI